MRILAVLRLLPDLTGDIDIADDGADIDREWIDLKLNEFDDHALEEALAIRDAVGGEVTAVAFDGHGVDRMLKTAIARGADGAVVLTHDRPPPMTASDMAAALADLATAEGADLVLTGVLTTEDVFGHLAPLLGARMGWPFASAISGVEMGEGYLDARQEHAGGYANILRVQLPAVLGIQTASRAPRYVSGSKLRDAMKEKIPQRDAGTAGGWPVATIDALAEPAARGGGEMLGEDAEAAADKVAAILRDQGVVG